MRVAPTSVLVGLWSAGLVGLVLMLVCTILDIVPLWATIVSCVLIGVSSTVWLPDLTTRLSSLGPRQALACVVLGYLTECILILVVSAFPHVVSDILVLLAQAAMLPAFLACRTPANAGRDGSWGPDRAAPGMPKLLVTYALLGFTSGVVSSFGIASDGLMAAAINVASFAIAALLVAAVVVRAHASFDFLLYVVGFPLLAASVIITMLLAPSPAATIPQQAADTFVEMLTWALCAYLVRYEGLPNAWVALFPTAGLFLGHLVGSVSGSIVVAYDFSPEGLAATMSLTVFAIMLFAVAALGKCGGTRGWGAVRPVENEPTSLLDRAVARMRSQYGLTPRESDVLRLLAHGRTKAYIATSLGISEDTAKTHISRVYRKVGVHSQQQVLDLLEEVEGTLESELI